MKKIVQAALELQRFLVRQQWKFCIIGGLAVIRWGRPRATQDVDVSVFAGMGAEEDFVDPLLAEFRGRIPDARQFALTSRVVLAEASNHVPLDIALAAFPMEEKFIDRASPFEIIPGAQLVIASLEDSLVQKSLAGRSRDWADIEGIIIRNAGHIDWNYVDSELGPLCELNESPENLARLAELRSRLEH